MEKVVYNIKMEIHMKESGKIIYSMARVHIFRKATALMWAILKTVSTTEKE